MIEDANFLSSFGRHWILRLGQACGLVEVAGEVMFAFDEDAVIVGANSGARRRFGAPLPGEAAPTSLLGRNLLELLDMRFDALWALARANAPTAREVVGRYTQPAVARPPTSVARGLSLTETSVAGKSRLPLANRLARNLPNDPASAIAGGKKPTCLRRQP